MKRVAPILAVAGLALCLVATAAGIAGSVSIRSLPPHVTQGNLEHLNAVIHGTSPRCTLSIKYADGHNQVLGAKRVIHHKVAWTWQVPSTAAIGSARAQVSCGKTGSSVGRFIVDRRLTPADVTVAKSGLTQIPDSYDGGTTVSYGLVLKNSSSDEDATNVEIDVNLEDGSGNAVGSDVIYLLGGIPAGATFYVGREDFTNDATPITSVSATVKIGESKRKALIAPAITNVRTSSDEFDGTAIVDGDVTNQATSQLSRLAEIDAVFFDSHGNVIGGDETFPPFALPPGSQAAFEITSALPASSVASVTVSADPYYANP